MSTGRLSGLLDYEISEYLEQELIPYRYTYLFLLFVAGDPV